MAPGDDRTLGHALNNLAGVHVMAGDLAAGERFMRAALAVKQRAGTGDVDIGRTLMNLAEITEGLDRGEFIKTEACQSCDLGRRCFGIRRGYAELHGTSELRPVRAAFP